MTEGLLTTSGMARVRRSRDARNSTEDVSTLEEEAPVETNAAPLLREMDNPTQYAFPTRRMLLGSRACVIGLGGGTVAAIYHSVLDALLDLVWKDFGPVFCRFFGIVPWMYIILTCTFFGWMTGVLIRLIGPPTAKYAPNSHTRMRVLTAVACQLRRRWP